MLNRKYIWLGILLTMILVIGLIPAGFAEAVPNYGFIPNSGEASVSKVDLVNNLEVARYYTAPRDTPSPIQWRTSRIAMDADGNAWVLNTGADGTGLQGSVVRIQADTTDLATSNGAALPFGTDEAVQIFPVGAAGEMPRAIAIDKDGFIWIGFYSGGQLLKFEYDSNAKTLTLKDTFKWSQDIKFYEMKFAPNDVLWISSRDSTPGVDGTPGIFSFNGTDFNLEKNIVPYSLLIADDGTVYATAYSNLLWIRNKDTSEWSSVVIAGSSENRGMAFDGLGKIWIASTVGTSGGTKVFSYNIASGLPGPIYNLTTGTTPVGVGQDAAGNMWAICRTDGQSQGFIEGFNPSTFVKIGAIQVGYRPYAYGDFVVPEIPKYGFCGYKFFNDTQTGLPGWTIELHNQAGALVATTTTDEFGKYCFSELPSGTYVVSEVLKTGWMQTFPVSGTHSITLPADLENLVENGDFEAGNSGFTNGYVFVDPATAKAVSPYTMGMGAEKTYTIGVDPFNYHDLWTSFSDHTEDDENDLMMIVNGSDDLSSPAIWTQTIPVTANSEYTFSFWGATSYPAAYALIDVYINDVLIDTFDAPETVGTWTEFSMLWNSGLTTSAKIKLVCTTEVHTGNDFALDDFSMINNFNFRNRERQKECFSETAWAYGGEGIATANNKVVSNNSEAWGWTNKYVGETQTYDLWAAAGQNILANGVKVGTVTVAPAGVGCVTVTYQVDEGFTLAETHLWVGGTELPFFLSGGKNKVNVPTSAPGLFDKAEMNISGPGIAVDGKSAEFTVCDLGADIWVAAHAVVDWCEYIE